jgi:hypothetical protein
MKKLHPKQKKGIVLGVVTGIIVTSIGILLLAKQDTPISQPVDEVVALEQPIVEPEQKQIELPYGGRTVLPGFRYVALYGNPDFPRLGSLGEQGIDETITRVRTLASEYQALSAEPVIPTLEIISTIASAGLTENNDYSQELSIDKLRPLVDRAKTEKMYVMLDLQPGRTPFFEQIKQYEELLREPHVGIALDPEWRLLTEKDRHLVRVGSVSAEEINQTYTWLADLVKQYDLPQKMFLVHQFKLSMIQNREQLVTNRPELAFVLHMDGHGSFGQKIDTWNTIQQNLPPNIFMAWKNFYDEDKPTPTPVETMKQPWFISYQ